MAELRRGTLTFVFTDIEGSTALVRQLRERYPNVQAAYREIVRETFARHRGEEVDTQGDSFFYVFSRVRDAVAAVAEAQRALHEHEWPEGIELRVRIGMHTGEPLESEEGYHGLGIHRAARIVAAGHGGQTLPSQATAAVLADDDVPGVELRDLGEHALKDLERPERIFQLDVDGLTPDFPPLRTGADQGVYAGEEARLAEAAAETLRRPVYRRPLVIGAVAGVLAAAVGIPVLALADRTEGDERSVTLVGDSVAVIDPERNAVVDEIRLGGRPDAIAVGEGSVWVGSANDETLLRIDPESREVVRTIGLGVPPSYIAVGAGSVWVASELGQVVLEYDPAINEVVGQTVVKASGFSTGPFEVHAGSEGVWAVDSGGLTRIDRAGRRLPRVLTPDDSFYRVGSIALGGGAAWLVGADLKGTGTSLLRIDPSTNVVTEKKRPGRLLGVGHRVWGRDSLAWGLQVRVEGRADPRRGGRHHPAPRSRAADHRRGAGAIWAVQQDGTVSRIDPRERTVVKTIRLGAYPIHSSPYAGRAVAVGEGAVWIAVTPGVQGARRDSS